MTDDRSDQTEELDDEFHSTLEIDDSSGWRVFIVPGILLLIVLGAVLFIVFSQGSAEPDPRVTERLKAKEAAENQPASPPPTAIMPPAAPAATEQNGAEPANATEPPPVVEE